MIQDLTKHQLDHLYDGQSNSIAALLLHMCAIEAAYQEYTFVGRNIMDNPERYARWQVPMDLGERTRTEIRGEPIAHYLSQLDEVRAHTLEQLSQRDDEWLWQESPWNDRIANNYWMWFHVYEDEISHRGQIRWLKWRIPRSAA